MKKVSRLIIVLLLMVSAVTTLIFMGLNGYGFSGGNAQSTAAGTAKLHLSDEEFSLGVGEEYQCSAFTADGTKTEEVRWSCSDISIAEVDNHGNVTGIAPGEAEIRVRYSENIIVSAKLWVYDINTVSSSTANAVTLLATDGSDASFQAMTDLARQLKCAKSNAVTRYSALLNALLHFSEMGAGSSHSPSQCWEELKTALTNTGIKGIEEDTLRRAALTAYCHGEKLVNDVTISFAGDCTFAYFNETDKDNMFPAVYRKSGSLTYPLDLTKNVFGADDLTMVNLEGTLTDTRKHRDKTFYFRGEPEYVNILTNSSVEAVTVENNHSFDYLEDGYADTLSNLKKAGVRYTGLYSPATIDVNGYHVVMLSLSMVSTYYKPEYQATIESDIKKYRSDDKTIIIVNLHWGVETSGTPEKWQIEAAHSMIDAGADMIIGHHPHVLQGIEQYKGHYIVYSLGNFSFGGNSAAASPSTVIFRASFNEDGAGNLTTRVSVVPCYTTSSGSTVNNFRPTPLFGNQGQGVVDRLLSLSGRLDGGITQINWNRIP